MKKLYEVVDLDVVRFDAEDVITTSGDPEPCSPDKLPPCGKDEMICERAICERAICERAICERAICGLELECPGNCNNK